MCTVPPPRQGREGVVPGFREQLPFWSGVRGRSGRLRLFREDVKGWLQGLCPGSPSFSGQTALDPAIHSTHTMYLVSVRLCAGTGDLEMIKTQPFPLRCRRGGVHFRLVYSTRV